MDTREVCLTSPPALTTNYIAQGSTEKLAGVDCYIISQTTSPSVGIISVYDVFGATKPGHLGLDLIASQLKTAVVVEPDFLEGDTMQESWFPMTGATRKLASEWEDRKWDVPWDGYLECILKVVQDAQSKFRVSNWGIVGFCFGGKIAVKLSGTDSVFKTSIQVHPAELDVEDAPTLTIPHRLMSSKDEPQEVIEQYESYFRDHPNKTFESRTYHNQPHGWAAARAKLDEPHGKQGFEQAFNEIVDFFRRHLEDTNA